MGLGSTVLEATASTLLVVMEHTISTMAHGKIFTNYVSFAQSLSCGELGVGSTQQTIIKVIDSQGLLEAFWETTEGGLHHVSQSRGFSEVVEGRE
jgi:hypothetical protein